MVCTSHRYQYPPPQWHPSWWALSTQGAHIHCCYFYNVVCMCTLYISWQYVFSYTPTPTSPHVYTRTDHDRIQETLDNVVQQYQGDCCMLMVLSTMIQEQQQLVPPEQHNQLAIASHGRHPHPITHTNVRRVLIWFHHIVSVTKRKNIVSWARELQLGGYSKPGWPGIVVIEGMEDDVEEYVQRLRALQWQVWLCGCLEIPLIMPCNSSLCNPCPFPHTCLPPPPHVPTHKAMHVRADETSTEGVRCFCGGFVELDPDNDGWGRLSRACRECGLEALFASALKL